MEVYLEEEEGVDPFGATPIHEQVPISSILEKNIEKTSSLAPPVFSSSSFVPTLGRFFQSSPSTFPPCTHELSAKKPLVSPHLFRKCSRFFSPAPDQALFYGNSLFSDADPRAAQTPFQDPKEEIAPRGAPSIFNLARLDANSRTVEKSCSKPLERRPDTVPQALASSPPDSALLEEISSVKEDLSLDEAVPSQYEENPTNLALRFYTSYEMLLNRKGFASGEEAERYFQDLENIQRLWSKLDTLGEDLPAEYTFEEGSMDEGFRVLEKSGLIEKGKRTFTTSELRTLKNQADAERTLLTQKIPNEYRKASQDLELLNQLMQIVQEILRSDKDFKANITRRMGGQ
ncbi:MAG: hypothetical protein AAGF04_03860 [Chlamydiota bacterium]